jgi:hypothetical protein
MWDGLAKAPKDAFSLRIGDPEKKLKLLSKTFRLETGPMKTCLPILLRNGIHANRLP